jgi:hypothetical protein
MNYWKLYKEIWQGTRPGVVPGRIVALLRDVIDGRQPVTAIRHPLGFICLPLERVDDRGICVHLWSGQIAGTQVTTSPVHSHSWDLLSQVLFGQVRNEVLHVFDAPDRPLYRVFEVRSQDEIDEIRATPRLVRTELARAETTTTGHLYTLPAGEFHTTVVAAGDGAATVVLGRSRSSAADLSLGAIDTHTHQVRRQRCDLVETVQAATIVAHRLETAYAAG